MKYSLKYKNNHKLYYINNLEISNCMISSLKMCFLLNHDQTDLKHSIILLIVNFAYKISKLVSNIFTNFYSSLLSKFFTSPLQNTGTISIITCIYPALKVFHRSHFKSYFKETKTQHDLCNNN